MRLCHSDFFRCVKVPNKAFASNFVLKSKKTATETYQLLQQLTVKMQWVVHKFLTGSFDVKNV